MRSTSRSGAASRKEPLGFSCDFEGDTIGDNVIGADRRGKWRAARGRSDPKFEASQTGPAACHDDRPDLPGCAHHQTGKQWNALVEAGCVDPPKRKRRGSIGREQAHRAIAQPLKVPPEAALRSGVNGKRRGWIPAA
jgi:hypothetical protein